MDKAEYHRARYLALKRPQIFGDRRCRCCEILLVSKHGAQRTYKYCRSCVDNGSSRRDQQRRWYAKTRERKLARVKAYYDAHRDYKRAYARRWRAKQKAQEQKTVELQTI